MPFKSRAQKEYLRINEPEIYERWMREYGDGYVVDAESNQSFTPPAAAISAAKKGLAQRKKWGRGGLSPAEAKSQGIDSGVTRARKISSGKVSRHDVRRMSAFNRHRKNNNPSKKMPDGGPTAGTIAWNLWGGSAGVNWAKKKSAAMNAEDFETPVNTYVGPFRKPSEGQCKGSKRHISRGHLGAKYVSLRPCRNPAEDMGLCKNCYDSQKIRKGAEGNTQWDTTLAMINHYDMEHTEGANYSYVPEGKHKSELPPFLNKELVDKKLPQDQENIALIMDWCGDRVRSNGTHEGMLAVGPNISEETVVKQLQDWGLDTSNINWKNFGYFSTSGTSTNPDYPDELKIYQFPIPNTSLCQWSNAYVRDTEYDDDGTAYTTFGQDCIKCNAQRRGTIGGDVSWDKNAETFVLGAETGFCPACGETDLMVQYYEDSGDFGCLECGHQWFDMMSAETFESPVSCKICGKTFDSFRGLNGHMNAHLPPHRKRAEDEEEDELRTYEVSVPVLHYYGIGPVEAYDEDEAADEVRNNWGYWRRTIQDNGDWGGPLWRYSPLTSGEPEAYEIFDSETFGDVDSDGQLAQALRAAREKSRRYAPQPLRITKLPHPDQKSLKDFEAETKELPFSVSRKDIALVSFGAILGVVSGVIGEVLAEFWLDRYRRDPELLTNGNDENA